MDAERRLPGAVLWDLDGTIADTEPAWIAAETAIARRHGHSWSTEQGLQMVGNPILRSAQMMREQLALPMTAEAIAQEMNERVQDTIVKTVVWRPGARELLRQLSVHRVPCALVTMSYRPLVDTLVSLLPDRTFAATVAGDEVTRGKPDPEAYLLAAQLLGVPAADCVAIEDSPTGVKAAAAAGCRAIVVPHHLPVVPDPAWSVWDSLLDVDVHDLLPAA